MYCFDQNILFIYIFFSKTYKIKIGNVSSQHIAFLYLCKRNFRIDHVTLVTLVEAIMFGQIHAKTLVQKQDSKIPL